MMKEVTKSFLRKGTLYSFILELKKQREKTALEHLHCDKYAVQNLVYLSGEEFCQIFDDPVIQYQWDNVTEIIKRFDLPEMKGGVNKGDQRAIFYLINYFAPRNILEIGTHIGCSTAHIALAIKNKYSRMTSVDCIDVNDIVKKHWHRFDSKYSPAELVAMAGVTGRVNFVKDDSIDFLKNCKDRFDFIFLDGSHNASMVFQEIPLALQLLNKNGVILLHDYFPDNQPLWSNSPPIPGPFLAINKIMKTEDNIVVIPLDELPWETKMNSQYTSLAILTRKRQ